jgi:hypothetical protein
MNIDMIANYLRCRLACSSSACALLLSLPSLQGCNAWPVAPSPAIDDARRDHLVLDAPEPQISAESVAQEEAITDAASVTGDESATELGSPAPFPRPDRPRTSIPQANAGRQQQPAITSVTASAPAWTEAGRSHEGRAIEAIQFGGTAEDRVLIVSSMAGSDPESVRFVDRLATRLSRIDLTGDDVAVLLIRSPNPDGLAGHYSTNSRGVELNRNFPSPRFPVARTTRTGPEPGSEPETQAIMSLLEEFRPTRVVHIRPGSGNTLLLLCDDSLHRRMTERVSELEFNVACHDGDFKAGSIEEYCRSQWGSEVVTVYLPGLQSMADSDGLLRGAALACLNVDLPQVIDDSEVLTAQPASTSETIIPHGEHGFVETLPPPTEHADGVHDSRYYELPPPPE